MVSRKNKSCLSHLNHISYCIIFETNIFIKMVIWMAADSKSDSTQGEASVFINFQETKICNINGLKK